MQARRPANTCPDHPNICPSSLKDKAGGRSRAGMVEVTWEGRETEGARRRKMYSVCLVRIKQKMLPYIYIYIYIWNRILFGSLADPLLPPSLPPTLLSPWSSGVACLLSPGLPGVLTLLESCPRRFVLEPYTRSTLGSVLVFWVPLWARLFFIASCRSSFLQLI